MKVIAVNLGERTEVQWKGKTIETGIYKYPVSQPIRLEKKDVAEDTVVDRKHHGGIYKAAYLFDADAYPYWKEKYPYLDWDWGMFGENITIEGLDESNLLIGSTYILGEALVEITQPREPCYKLGIRFKDQSVLKDFIAHERPGSYIKILHEGKVAKGDIMRLENESTEGLSIKQFYQLLYSKEKNHTLLKQLINHSKIPADKRKQFEKLI